jgi:DNA-binding CsgD family transcriptional regulator
VEAQFDSNDCITNDCNEGDCKDLMISVMPARPMPERFELRGKQFVVMTEDAWLAAAEGARMAEAQLQLVGRLQVGGAQHVILAGQATAQEFEPPRSFFEVLTPRERQIASMVAEGCADKVIARRLAISEYTVREHLRRVFHKANVSKRAALASLLAGSA